MAHSDERRKLPRRRTRLSAAAVSGAAGEVVLCTIKDQSESGARLLIGPDVQLPDAFELIELTSGRASGARVVWRDAAFIGVTLHDPRSLSPPQTAEDRRLLDIRARLTSKGGRARD